jgi:hypothetical protein
MTVPSMRKNLLFRRCESAPDSGLACSGGPASRTPRLSLSPYCAAGVSFSRGDFGFQRADHVIDTFEVAEIDWRDLVELHVAGQVMFAQVGDQPIRRHFSTACEPLARTLQLMRREPWSEAKHLRVVNRGYDFRREPSLANVSIVLGVEFGDCDDVGAPADGIRLVVVGAEYQFLVPCIGVRHDSGQGGVEQISAIVIAARDNHLHRCRSSTITQSASAKAWSCIARKASSMAAGVRAVNSFKNW